MLNQENRIATPVGEVVPQYETAAFGERQKKHRSSIDFFQNGQIKSVALNEQLPIRTPLGTIKAELVTFYEDGAINRIFPLNGLIDGFWSETNERGMTETMEFELPVGRIGAKAISIHFYPDGKVKSLTVWPGETFTVDTPVGPIRSRAGLSLYPDGALRSVEPVAATTIPTPVGPIKAFDPDIIGMHADQNSVQFHPDGSLAAVKTIHTGIRAVDQAGTETILQPHEAESYIDPSQMRTVPMTLGFTPGEVTIEARKPYRLSLLDSTFSTFEMQRVLRETCVDCPEDETCCQNGGDGGNCGSCGGC
jgi:hypothetical protein